MGYDPKCYELASLFLSDNPDKNSESNRDELAQHIQTEIEDWIEFILMPTHSALKDAVTHSEFVCDDFYPRGANGDR